MSNPTGRTILKALELINKNIYSRNDHGRFRLSAENVVIELVGQTRVIDANITAKSLTRCIALFLDNGKFTHAKFTAEMITVVLGNY